jgi:hypothetical protein
MWKGRVRMTDNFRERYFEALGIGADEQCKLKAVRELAHNIRQFEIELYWKRATYFWAFQLIAFTMLGLLLKDGKIDPLGQLSLGRLLIPAPIGVITALAGYITARGSKFWQENWEAHVDLLEEETKERLTQVIVCNRREFSVSRINQRLLSYLVWAWALVMIAGAIPNAADLLRPYSPWFGCIVVVITALAGGALLRIRTDFTGCTYSGDGKNWTDYPPKNRRSRARCIIWRGHSAKETEAR